MSVESRHIVDKQSQAGIESRHIVVILSSKSITLMDTLMGSHSDHHHHIPEGGGDHTFTLYKTYDHDQMPLSRASDGMEEKFFVCMRKFKNGSLTIRCGDLVKIGRSGIKGSWTW